MDTVDWRNIDWQPINALTGGTLQFPLGLNLTPWFLKGFDPPKLPGQQPVHPSGVQQPPGSAPYIT